MKIITLFLSPACKYEPGMHLPKWKGRNDDLSLVEDERLKTNIQKEKETDVKHCLWNFLLVVVTSLSACSVTTTPLECNINLEADSLEPNDTPDDAAVLSDTELTGTFKEGDKPDYFTVSGGAGDVISLEKKFGIGEPTLSVKNGNDEELEVRQTSATVQSVTLIESGAHLIQVGLQTTGDQCPDDIEYDLSFTAAP